MSLFLSAIQSAGVEHFFPFHYYVYQILFDSSHLAQSFRELWNCNSILKEIELQFYPLLPSRKKKKRVEHAKLKFQEAIYLPLPVKKNRNNSGKTRLEEWNLFAADISRNSLLKNYPTAIRDCAFAFVADKAISVLADAALMWLPLTYIRDLNKN